MPGETYEGGYGISKPNSHTTTASCIVERKVFSSTKPTCLTTGVVCHPDTEQNRPYKNPLALLGFEPGTYYTASENFTSVPHYSTIIDCTQVLHLGGTPEYQ